MADTKAPVKNPDGPVKPRKNMAVGEDVEPAQSKVITKSNAAPYGVLRRN